MIYEHIQEKSVKSQVSVLKFDPRGVMKNLKFTPPLATPKVIGLKQKEKTLSYKTNIIRRIFFWPIPIGVTARREC